MALAFPVSLPSGFGRGPSVAVQTFRLDQGVVFQPSAGGRVYAVGVAQPRWVSAVETTELQERHAREWRAWLSAQGEGARTFVLPDLSRRRPGAYPQGVTDFVRAGWALFDGTVAPGWWSVDATRTVLTVAGTLPSGFVLSPGDLLGVSWPSLKQTALEVVEGGTTNTLGAVTLEIHPALPLVVPVASATLSVLDAAVVARIVPGSVDYPDVRRGGRARVRFRAEETLE